MGITIAFYSALPYEFITLFASEDEEQFFREVKRYPVADFSFHLLFPEDLDRLCQILRSHHFPVPTIFRELLVTQVWYDGDSESLTIIADSFPQAIASLNDTLLELVAQEWSLPFHYQEPLHQTPAYQALLQLRAVSQDVVTQKKALLLHLLG